MKKFATALALVLMAGTTLGAASPALAQAKPKAEKPVPPKLSKPILAIVIAAQKLQTAGDHAGAIAKLDEAKDVPRAEKDDALIMAKLKLYSAQVLKDNIKLEEALSEAVLAPSLEAEEKITFTKFIAGLASNRKDYQKAWTAYEAYLTAKPDDVDMLVQAASVNAALNNRPRVVELLSKAIALREAAGQKGDRSWYEFRAQAVIDGNMADQIMPALLGWVKAFPEPRSYNTAIELTKQRAGNLDNNTLIDFGRLLWAAGAMTTAGNYLEYAEAALDRGMPNEADLVLKEGIAKKLIDPTKVGIGEIVKQATAKNAESKAGIAALEKEAKTSPRIALVVADTLANLGQHEKAVPFYKGLVGAAGIDQDTVNLRLAVALMKAGDKAGAKAAFDAVKAGPRRAIAQFYDVLLAAA
jgi:tetratricopeptide (TPR) repeat protein